MFKTTILKLCMGLMFGMLKTIKCVINSKGYENMEQIKFKEPQKIFQCQTT